MNEKPSVISKGEEQFTDTHVFENCTHKVRAMAQVHFIVTDKGTGEVVKREDHNIQFYLGAVDDSDEMDFKEMEKF
ncbi:MAG: hypothetical protein ACYTFW_26850 [Planctomycetota bacterium]|jgi:hypothetical protein